MKNWCLQYSDGSLAGYPEPLIFKTRKEAHKRMQKLEHQTQRILFLIKTNRVVNCKEK